MRHEIDTSGWKEFIIGDLFEKLQLDVKKEDFSKTFDASEERTEEFNLPLVNAKHGNNGIMYYGREADFETAEMTIDIVQNGAIATGDVYAQPQRTGVLWDAYLVKPKVEIDSAFTLMFLATVLEKAIKDKFSYDDKCVWDKAKLLSVTLPCTCDGDPDWEYMDVYMSGILAEERDYADKLTKQNFAKHEIDTSGWKEFKVGELFDTFKPPVLHDRQVTPSENGLPYVVRTKFNNGIKDLVVTGKEVEPSPAGVITWGAENASFFYQEKPFYSGRDIYYLDTRRLNMNTCHFLAAALSTVISKYPYNYGLFPDLLKGETIRLPVTLSGKPDWDYMDLYMTKIMAEEKLVADELTA